MGARKVGNLVVRAKSGATHEECVAAFGELVGQFQDMAFGYAYAILGDFHLAEDATQEAFITAFRRLATLEHHESFPGWLRRIVQTACDHMTRRKRLPTMPLAAAADVQAVTDRPEEMAQKREMHDSILAAIAQLPDAQRQVTTLFYINGYSHKDIAEFLDVSPSAVNNHLAVSRKLLKKRMLTMVEDTFKSHRPGPEKRQAIVDELMSRKEGFDSRGWKPSQEWANWWHNRRMEDVRANAAQYGIKPDESLPRMLPEYQAMHTFRDDFLDVPRRWGVPADVDLILLRDLYRQVRASPLAVVRWVAEGLPVLHYHPWFAYDRAKARAWIDARGVRADERMADDDVRQPLLLTLRTLSQGRASVGEARQVFQGFSVGTIRAAGNFSEVGQVDLRHIDSLWADTWQASHQQERLANARQYGLAQPTDNDLGIPKDALRGRVFEIRDLTRRLGVSPFDIIRWTAQGMPCLRLSPFVRWDADRVAAWLGDRGGSLGKKLSPKELDSLEDFVLPAVAEGAGTAEEAHAIFACWAGLT